MSTTAEVLEQIKPEQTIVVMQGENELARGFYTLDEKTFEVDGEEFKNSDIRRAMDYCDSEWEIQLKAEQVNIHSMSDGEFIDFCQDFQDSEDPDFYIDMIL